MKTALLGFFLVFGTVAFGQTVGSVLSGEPQVVEFHSHEQRAYQHDMGRAEGVMEESNITVARGERPLWEVAPPLRYEMSLGDAARIQKEAHAGVKKSTMVWTNY